jgi:hypothetical protein
MRGLGPEPLPCLTPPRLPKQMGAGHPEQAEEAVSKYPTVLKWIVRIPHAEAVLVISMWGGCRSIGPYVRVLRSVVSKPNFDPSRVVVRDVESDRVDPTLLGSTKLGPPPEIGKFSRSIALEPQSTRSLAVPRSSPPLSDRSRTAHCRTPYRSSTSRPLRPLIVQRPSARLSCPSGARSPLPTWTRSRGAG